MADKTGIKWTNASWNWATGCTWVDWDVCPECYMFALYPRLKKMGLAQYQWVPNEVHVIESELGHQAKPFQWGKKPRMIFTNSMSDYFHEAIPFETIDRATDIIRRCPQHTFQVLTKRSWRMMKYFETRTVPDNMWLGVSVATRKMLFKVDHLRKIRATTRFLSVEPIRESLLPINLKSVHWVILGYMSGPNWRKYAFDLNWAREIRDQCQRDKIPFFYKQGTAFKPGQDALLDGKEWREFPK